MNHRDLFDITYHLVLTELRSLFLDYIATISLTMLVANIQLYL